MAKNNKTIILVVVAVAVIAALGIVAFVKQYDGHNWNLGLGSQKSAEDIQTVQAALDAIDNGAIVDTYVKNANTSGTPFGHTVQVNILADAEVLSPQDAADIEALVAQVTSALNNSGVSDTYDVTIGLNSNSAVTSGAGSRENPLTSAERLSGADIIYEESLTVQ